MRTKLKVLAAIEKLGRPTVREIGTQVGISVATVHHHLSELKDEGLVTWEVGKARTIQVVEQSQS